MKNRKRLQRVMFRKDFPTQKMDDVISSLQDESFLAFLEMVFLRLPNLKQLTVPVLIIGAEKDYLISVKDTKQMAKRYGLEAQIVKDASHCLMLETGWEEVAASIKKFVVPH
jgi:pimeloyl-ACP methyl ester carboxylesterase